METSEDFYKKIDELVDIAKKQKIPLFITAATSETSNNTNYTTNFISPFYLGIKLKKDLFPEYMLVQNGFKVKRTIETDLPEDFR